MAILEKDTEINTTTLEAIARTTKIVIGKQQQKNRSDRDHSELQLLCRYNSCKAVANNGEGWKTAFRKENKSLISPDSRIRRGLGTGTYIILYKLLASLLCPELNLINI